MPDRAATPALGHDPELRAALEHAHLPTLVMALVHLTGDTTWLSDRYKPARPRGGEDPDDGGFPVEVQREIRDAAEQAVLAWRAGKPLYTDLSDAELHRMMCHYTGENVDPATVPMAAEEIGLVDRDDTWRLPAVPQATERLRAIVIGAGLSGICAGIKLDAMRIPYVVLERGTDVGGTWYANRYPGAGVDSPSHLYQYSFEQHADWSRYFAKRDEIHAYYSRVCDKYGVRKNIRFRTEVTRAIWREELAEWEVHVQGPDGPDVLYAPIVISAVGLLNRPSIPAIPGAGSFRGPAMHTAEWDTEVDLTGKRVAVIGTGASAMQLVPAAAQVAGHVTIFQRSPQWATPMFNYHNEVPEEVRYLMRHVPYYLAWYRYRQFWNWNDRLHPHLQIDPNWEHPDRSINAVNDRTRKFLTNYIVGILKDRPDLIEKCVPDYPPYGKRMLLDNGWFETLLRDNVELVTEKITEITPNGVVTADGVEHEADVLAYATGFEAHKVLYPIEIIGRNGYDLRKDWGDDDARAYLGICIPDVPNFFCVFGPNTALGHGGSIVFHNEIQIRYIMGMLRMMAERDIRSVAVRRDVHDEYNRRVDEAHSRMIWSHRGMTTWYRNRAGRVVSLSPWRLVDYWHMTRQPNLDDFIVDYHGSHR